ncbi:MAG: 2'-deoxycytidine 5'-triphosphate deaminase [Nitrospiraceae bacterium]
MYEHEQNLFPELKKDLQGFASAGILPSQKIRELTEQGHIFADTRIEEDQIQPASIDLRLGPKAYRVQASFLPGSTSTVATKIRDLIMTEVDLTCPAAFEKGCVYIVPLMENLRLPNYVSAKANPKSSTGRLDIFTRLICDYGEEFERTPKGYKGRLYTEIVPRTFTVILREGMRLNQLRFVRGSTDPSDSQLHKLDKQETLVYTEGGSPQDAIIDEGLNISVNLQGDKNSNIIGYRAKKNAPAIDLTKIGYYPPGDFWEAIAAPNNKTIILSPDDFHILVSKQKVRIPHDYAAEMVAYDPSIGEFRIHYACFFDPGFGYGSGDIEGTPAVLEVRSHEVPFLIEDGQIVGRLIYERLLAKPDKIYGLNIGSSYQRQGLTLSKYFKV